MRLVLFLFLAASAWAGLFEDFLHATRLTQFSVNVLRDEQRNFELFAREIEHFSCLSNEGKKEAIAQLGVLQEWIQNNTTEIEDNLQNYMRQYLRSTLSNVEMQSILEILDNSAYGKRLRAHMQQYNLDILNLPFETSPAFYPSAKEERDIAPEKLNIFLKFISFETKRQILLGNKAYRKDLQQGIQKLQEIFIKEGCAIE